MSTDGLSDRELLKLRLKESSLSTTAFAVRVLLREPRTVRRWLAGDSPIPAVVLTFLRHPVPAPWPRGRRPKAGR